MAIPDYARTEIHCISGQKFIVFRARLCDVIRSELKSYTWHIIDLENRDLLVWGFTTKKSCLNALNGLIK